MVSNSYMAYSIDPDRGWKTSFRYIAKLVRTSGSMWIYQRVLFIKITRYYRYYGRFINSSKYNWGAPHCICILFRCHIPCLGICVWNPICLKPYLWSSLYFTRPMYAEVNWSPFVTKKAIPKVFSMEVNSMIFTIWINPIAMDNPMII